MKNKLSIFIIILFIYSLSHAKEMNMILEETITTVPTTQTTQEQLASKKFLENYKKIDHRLIELDKRVKFSKVFEKKNKVTKYLNIDSENPLKISIKDENNDPYYIFGCSINEYRNELTDKLTKKVYEISIAAKETPTVILDGKSYVTSGMSIRIISFYGEDSYVIAQHKFLNSLLNSTTSTIPYIKEHTALGELVLKNSFFNIESEYNLIWIDNNILVNIFSRNISKDKIIEIAQWINAYIK